jgi:hypothetical protein
LRTIVGNRLLAHIIEDATLIKLASEGITKIHVRFNGGKTETLTALKPKSSAAPVKTPMTIVNLVDKFLEHHINDEIVELLNKRGVRPCPDAHGSQHGLDQHDCVAQGPPTVLL